MGQVIEHLVVTHGLVAGATVGYVPVLLLDPEQGEEGMPIPGPAGVVGPAGPSGGGGVGPAGPPGLDGESAAFDGMMMPPGGTPSPPTGPAGGDLAGTYPNPSVGPNAVTYAKVQKAGGSNCLLGNNTNLSNQQVAEVTIGTGLDMSGGGPLKMADVPNQTLKGNVSGSTAGPADLTPAQVRTFLALSAADVRNLPVLLADDPPDGEPVMPLSGRLLQVFVGSGAAHAPGDVPDPGATAYPNTQRVLKDDATFAPVKGQVVAYLFVATDESTAGTTYANLATADSVTFTLDGTQDLLVEYVAFVYNTTANGGNGSQVELGGVAQLAVVQTVGGASAVACQAISYKLAAVGAGSRTVRVTHKTLAGQTAHFLDRSLKVSILG